MASARRAHTKSKNGCEECKKKRVKCDEEIPCRGCSKSGLACSLAKNLAAAPVPSPGPASSVPSPAEPRPPDESFAITDFTLFHHFLTSTSEAMRNEPELPFPWQTAIPGMAPRHPYLLHEILAVAAIHLRHLHPDDPIDYRRLAREHQTQALSGFRDALASQNIGVEAPALFACSALIVNYYFTEASDPASLLFHDDPPGSPEWMFPIRGCKMLIRQFPGALADGPLGKMLQSYEGPWPHGVSPFPFVASESDSQIRLLDERLQSLTSQDEQVIYSPVVVELRRSFTISEQGSCIARKSAALAFPSNLPTEFLEEMSTKKRPYALVLMAFWCVLLNRIPQKWWLRGGCVVRDMVDVIKSMLPLEFEDLIEWPAQQVGLYPASWEQEVGADRQM